MIKNYVEINGRKFTFKNDINFKFHSYNKNFITLENLLLLDDNDNRLLYERFKINEFTLAKIFLDNKLFFEGLVIKVGRSKFYETKKPAFRTIEIVDFKEWLNRMEPVDQIFINKTVIEAINSIKNSLENYKIKIGRLNFLDPNKIINFYNAYNQTHYQFLDYISKITGSLLSIEYNDNVYSINYDTEESLNEASAFDIDNINRCGFIGLESIDDKIETFDTINYQRTNSRELISDLLNYENISPNQINTSKKKFYTKNKMYKLNAFFENKRLVVATSYQFNKGKYCDIVFDDFENVLEFTDAFFAKNNINSPIKIEYFIVFENSLSTFNLESRERIAKNTGTTGFLYRFDENNDLKSNADVLDFNITKLQNHDNNKLILKIKFRNNIPWSINQKIYIKTNDENEGYFFIREMNYRVYFDKENINYYTSEYELISNLNKNTGINFFDIKINNETINFDQDEIIITQKNVTGQIDLVFYDFITEVKKNERN